MKKDLLVSLIIPAYNEEKVIGTLLKSINRQTYKNIEVIVIDDASWDKTANIARIYTDKVFTKAHSERSVQRNFGARISKGDFLIFLDADMELTPGVVKDVLTIMEKGGFAVLVIPERTVGKGFIQGIRKFEREMYMNDPSVEVARVFKREVFFEYGGYDKNLTGPEDYDLPYRIGKKYEIGRSNEYLLHHEEDLTLIGLLEKKYLYAKGGAMYAQKYPELISTQGNLLFRKAYFRSWKKFLRHPLLGLCFIVVRILETIFAVLGYISVVGLLTFFKSFIKMLLLPSRKNG